MLAVTVSDVKVFMSKLLKEDLFDPMGVREVEIRAITYFCIDGAIDREFLNTDRTHCLWQEIKPIVVTIIKGNKRPRSLKLVLSLPKEELPSIHENAAAAFMNIAYEQDKITLTTATSQKTFSLDKSLDHAWETYVTNFLSRNGIAFTNVE